MPGLRNTVKVRNGFATLQLEEGVLEVPYRCASLTCPRPRAKVEANEPVLADVRRNVVYHKACGLTRIDMGWAVLKN